MSNNEQIWISQAEGARLADVAISSVEKWIAGRKISTNADRRVNLVEIFQRKLAQLDRELERLQSKQASPEIRLMIARANKLAIETKLKQRELAQLEASLIALDEVQRDLMEVKEAATVAINKIILLAPKLATMHDPRAIAAFLQSSADVILRELSDGLLIP